MSSFPEKLADLFRRFHHRHFLPKARCAAAPPSLAFLGTFFLNDNEGLEPTNDAERARLKRTGEEFAQRRCPKPNHVTNGVPRPPPTAQTTGPN